MPSETLGILITSSAHPDYIIKLTQAAVQRGKIVRLLFSGKGIPLLATPEIRELGKMAELRIHKGADEAVTVAKNGFCPEIPAAPTDIIFKECKRFVVF